MKRVHVAVGVVKDNDTFFICKRGAEQHQGGLWEFPGGKVEHGETVTQALARELREEIDIDVHSSIPLMQINHQYPDKHVCLDVHIVEDFSGKAIGAEGQTSLWVARDALCEYEFPAANKAILDKLV